MDPARCKEEEKSYLKCNFYLNFKCTRGFPSVLKVLFSRPFGCLFRESYAIFFPEHTLALHVETSPLGSHGSTGRHCRPCAVLQLTACLVFRVFFQLFTRSEGNSFCQEYVDCLKAKRLFYWELLFCRSITLIVNVLISRRFGQVLRAVMDVERS